MTRKTGRTKEPSTTLKKTWGQNGFSANISFGCYDYTVQFVPQSEIPNLLTLSPEVGKVDGAIGCDEQLIVIASDISEQLQKLTLCHELTHMMLLNNGIGGYDDKKTVTQDENYVDELGGKIFEVIKRNQEMVRWLQE